MPWNRLPEPNCSAPSGGGEDAPRHNMLWIRQRTFETYVPQAARVIVSRLAAPTYRSLASGTTRATPASEQTAALTAANASGPRLPGVKYGPRGARTVKSGALRRAETELSHRCLLRIATVTTPRRTASSTKANPYRCDGISSGNCWNAVEWYGNHWTHMTRSATRRRPHASTKCRRRPFHHS